MKYSIKQRKISIGNDFDIRDRDGNKLFFVDGKGFTFGQDLSIKDSSKTKVARIKQKLFTFSPTFKIDIGGKETATVSKKMFTFKPTFVVKHINNNDILKASGNFFNYDYQIKRGNKKVANVSKKIFALSDSYGVDVGEGENQLLILSTAIVIDLLLHKGK